MTRHVEIPFRVFVFFFEKHQTPLQNISSEAGFAVFTKNISPQYFAAPLLAPFSGCHVRSNVDFKPCQHSK